MNRDQALQILNEFIENENLKKHMLAVEACMRFYAEQYGEDADLWGITGLLHDFDWEIHPSMESHPQDGAPLLRERGVPEEIVRAILSHADHTGVPRKSRLEKALYACDEITGLVVAVALVRPTKSIHDVKVRSVMKKWKDKSFAAGADRDEIQSAVEEFGVPLNEHIDNVITALQRIAHHLGLEGSE